MATKQAALPKTWEAFCKQTGRDPKALPNTKGLDEKTKNRVLAVFILPLVIKHVNGDNQPDYTNSDQWKYEPRWVVNANKKNPSGVDLSYFDYDYWLAITFVGPAFVFTSVPGLQHVTKYFKKHYEALYL